MERTTALFLSAVVLAAVTAPSHAGLIYLTVESGGRHSSHLYAYDTVRGVKSDLGEMSGRKYTTDLAYSPDGRLYGVGWSNGYANGAAHLFTIEPDPAGQWAKWEMQPVKGKGKAMDRSVNAAAFDDDGSLYVASAQGRFQKLQLTGRGRNRQWEAVASADMDWGSAGDLAFGADGSQLYVALAGGKLGRVDYDADSRHFGRVSIVGDTGYDNLYGLAMVDGTLYGTTVGGGNYGMSYLVEIDVGSGAAEEITCLGRGVWGATGTSAGSPIPEPASLAMLALGAVALPIRRRLHQRAPR